MIPEDAAATIDYSRPTRFAARAAGIDEGAVERRLRTSTVRVTVDPHLPGAVLAASVLIDTLQRQPGAVALGPAGLDDQQIRELARVAHAVNPAKPLRLDDGDEVTCAVHVGCDERAPLRVIPDRHGVRLARTGALRQTSAPSGLGVVYAAAVAAAEVFKDVAAVRPERHVRHDRLDFCPVSLSGDLDAAPEFRGGEIALGLVGLGAVGTATARILSLLPLQGSVLLIDPQRFERENLGTYSLGGFEDAAARREKVAVVSACLEAFRVASFVGRVEEAVPLIDDRRLPWPSTVLSGLDSVEARYAVQLLWPDLLIDSATDDTMCGMHACPDGCACLMCLFARPDGRESALSRLADATGLTVEQLGNGQRLLEEDDLAGKTDEAKARLRAHIGTPLCGLARAIGLVDDGDEEYLPSIPFVSQQAACLGVGRLVSELTGWNRRRDVPNFVQYDSLVGPGAITELRLRPRDDCYSVAKRPVIEAVRASRRL